MGKVCEGFVFTKDKKGAACNFVDIFLPCFKAFVCATRAFYLWDEVVSEDGLLLLQGDEVLLTEISWLQFESQFGSCPI
ncbi:hypothetical protein V3565_05655 [Bartonella sp. B10]